METLWMAFVHGIEHALALLTQDFGGDLALAIIAVSLAARLLLLPLSYVNAREGLARQRIAKHLKPHLDALRERHKDNPRALLEATRKLHKEHGLNFSPWRSLGIGAMQLPMMVALSQAIRHALAHGARSTWLSNLLRPNPWIALTIAALSALAMHLNPALPEQARMLLIAVQTLMVLGMVWHLSAGVALYWGTSSVVGLIQALLLHRHEARISRLPQPL